MYRIFIQSSVDENLCCFRVFRYYKQCCCERKGCMYLFELQFCVGIYQEWDCWTICQHYSLFFEKPPNYSAQWLYQFTLLPTVQEGSFFFWMVYFLSHDFGKSFWHFSRNLSVSVFKFISIVLFIIFSYPLNICRTHSGSTFIPDVVICVVSLSLQKLILSTGLSTFKMFTKEPTFNLTCCSFSF